MSSRNMILCLPFLLCILAPPAGAQCVETDCHFYDFSTCEGAQGSSHLLCNMFCICTIPTKLSYLETGHPGLFTKQLAGRLFVSSVLRDSPAEQAGILPGDEIEAVNDSKVGVFSCGAEVWDAGRSGKARLLLRRGTAEWKVEIKLASVRDLLETQWTRDPAGDGTIETVAFTPRVGAQYHSLYNLGMQLSTARGRMMLAAVLHGSQAESRGLTPGDEIVEFDGVPASEITDDLSAHHSIGDAVSVTVRHGGGLGRITMTWEGTSQILRREVRDSSPSDRALATLRLR